MAEEMIEYNIKLIVEDGSFVESANSYVSLAYADEYAKNRNYDTWMEAPEYVRAASIIKGMDYVDNMFDWRGRRKHRDQSLAFPRVDIFDDEHFNYDNIIPEKLKKAICEAAFYALEQYTLFLENGLNDTNVGTFEKKLIADPPTIEYDNIVPKKDEYMTIKDYMGDNSPIDYTSKYQSLDRMLKGLFWEKGKTRICHRVKWIG